MKATEHLIVNRTDLRHLVEVVFQWCWCNEDTTPDADALIDEALKEAHALEAAAKPAQPVDAGVHEALHRLIENAALLGAASRADATLVAKHQDALSRAPAAQPEPEAPADWDEDVERRAFYKAHDETERKTGHAPTLFDTWLIARGLMTTDGRRRASAQAEAPALREAAIDAILKKWQTRSNGQVCGYLGAVEIVDIVLDAALAAPRSASVAETRPRGQRLADAGFTRRPTLREIQYSSDEATQAEQPAAGMSRDEAWTLAQQFVSGGADLFDCHIDAILEAYARDRAAT